MAKFLRELNLMDTSFLVIGSVIGSGIFMTTGFIAESLPSPGWILIVWIVGGIIVLSGALSFAELGVMFPKAGGQYVYLREAYGKWTSFFFGWGFFWFIMCGGIAALAVAFAEFVGYFMPSISNQSYILEWCIGDICYSLSWGQMVAVVAIVFLSGVNCYGVRSGILVQNIFTFLRLASVAALIILGFAIGKKAALLSSTILFPEAVRFNFETMKHFGVALIAVLWTYDGWYSATATAEEIKNPRKILPLGLLIGTLSVTCVYVLINLVYIMALPVGKMRGVARIGELASTSLFGSGITSLISGAIMISIFGCLSATILYGPRVYFAMAEDGAFFRRMAYIHPRYRVPTRAIKGQAIWASLLCLSGTYQDLYEFVVFALVIFFAATGIAVVVLRLRQPERKRPYKVWGYPFLPLLFALINILIFVNTIFAQPLKSAIGLFILLLGIPAFLYWKARAKKAPSRSITYNNK
jgi:APA family basic amino acid/polyamine antiporter